jgi:hypothetical protein
MTPNNPYSLSKSFGEQICDAAVRRTAGSTGWFFTPPPPPSRSFSLSLMGSMESARSLIQPRHAKDSARGKEITEICARRHDRPCSDFHPTELVPGRAEH